MGMRPVGRVWPKMSLAHKSAPKTKKIGKYTYKLEGGVPTKRSAHSIAAYMRSTWPMRARVVVIGGKYHIYTSR